MKHKEGVSDGKEIIKAIVLRLKDKDIPPDDNAIITELRGLGRYDLSQLVTFGDIDYWVSARNYSKQEQP